MINERKCLTSTLQHPPATRLRILGRLRHLRRIDCRQHSVFFLLLTVLLYSFEHRGIRSEEAKAKDTPPLVGNPLSPVGSPFTSRPTVPVFAPPIQGGQESSVILLDPGEATGTEKDGKDMVHLLSSARLGTSARFLVYVRNYTETHLPQYLSVIASVLLELPGTSQLQFDRETSGRHGDIKVAQRPWGSYSLLMLNILPSRDGDRSVEDLAHTLNEYAKTLDVLQQHPNMGQALMSTAAEPETEHHDKAIQKDDVLNLKDEDAYRKGAEELVRLSIWRLQRVYPHLPTQNVYRRGLYTTGPGMYLLTGVGVVLCITVTLVCFRRRRKARIHHDLDDEWADEEGRMDALLKRIESCSSSHDDAPEECSTEKHSGDSDLLLIEEPQVKPSAVTHSPPTGSQK